MIKEVIVVEGKDDITAVKAAVECEVIATGGFRFSDKFIERLRFIQKQKGIIVFTDPDYAGEKIRKPGFSRVRRLRWPRRRPAPCAPARREDGARERENDGFRAEDGQHPAGLPASLPA